MRVLPLVLVLALPLAACNDPRREIVGRWQQEGGSDQVEFLADGTVTVRPAGTANVGGLQIQFNGRYRFEDDTHVRFEFSGPAAYFSVSGVCQVTISGGVLEVQDANGTIKRYTRQP